VGFPIITSRPDPLFGIEDVAWREPRVAARMRVGSRLLDEAGRTAPGALGVVADNVLGYAIIATAPPGGWAVTTEMSIDVLGPLPGEGELVRAEAELVAGDGSGGFAEGTVVDVAGRVVARLRQRGRFVDRPREIPENGRGRDGGLPDLVPRPTADGVGLDLEVTEPLGNPLGNLHGGVSLWAVEAVGRAALRQGNPALRTASVHLTYLRAAPVGTTLRIGAEPRHTGRSMGLADVRVLLADGRPCIEATVVGHVT
jgi:uncharacterized protein (TIGR00369 family)